MRISDWSSDVCSSDLFSARLLEPIEQDLVIVAGSIAYSDRIARRHRSAGWAREISLSIPVSQPDFWKQKKIASTLSEAVERSEEHTSELQSLMRISYAVFCLKKKNHKRIHNTTIYTTT